MQVGVGRKTGFEDWTRPAKVSPGGSLPALLSFMPKLLLSLSCPEPTFGEILSPFEPGGDKRKGA